MNQQVFDLTLSRFIYYSDSAKIRLRPFNEDDINPIYVNWLNNPEVVRYSNQRFFRHTEESCRQYLAAFIGSTNNFLAIEDSASRSMIGSLTVYRSLHHRTADIGIMVGNPVWWGRGIGFEAFRTIVEALERSCEIRKITAGTLAINVGMIRIMEKAGLSLEATRRDQELIDGRAVDLLYYAKFCDA
jgi:ribosomal-protein-alanine N-acetyltransferase